MPRRNNNVKHTPFNLANAESGKTRYPTKRQAEEAAQHQMLINLGLELYVYKSDLGGWYITRLAPKS